MGVDDVRLVKNLIPILLKFMLYVVLGTISVSKVEQTFNKRKSELDEMFKEKIIKSVNNIINFNI